MEILRCQKKNIQNKGTHSLGGKTISLKGLTEVVPTVGTKTYAEYTYETQFFYTKKLIF